MKKAGALFLIASMICAFGFNALASEAETVSGFYGIEAAQNVSVEAFENDTKISASEKNIAGDETPEQVYENSDRLEVSCTAATEGEYYGVILVEGSGLPTKDTEIYYIDQVTAESDTVDFNVYPLLPEATSDMTLYISSSAENAGLVTIPLTYAVNAEVIVPEEPPVEPEEPAFIPTFNTSMSASLSLKAIVYLNVQCSFADYGEEDPAELVKSTGLLVWNNATAPANDEDATYETAEKITLGGEWSNNLLNVRTEGIPAKNLGDSLAFRPYYVAADGTYVYGRMIRGYSPKRYCYNTIGKAATSATEKAMLVSLLNYGTAAQLHFGHNTDDLMNSDLTEAQKGSLWTLDLVRSNYSVPAAKEGDLARNSSVVKSRSASLTLAGAIEVNFQMGVAGNIAKVEMLCWDEAAYNAAEVLTEENATLVADMELNGSLYSYTYPGQAARKAFTTIYGCAKVTDTEGNVYYSGVVGYSPERFAYLKTTGTGVAETEKELAQRLAVYGDAARTHFGEE